MNSILIIEDSKSFNCCVADLLRKCGYMLYQAFDLAEAKLVLKKNAVDYILLDLNLPDGNGEDFIDYIKDTTDSKIIVMTSNQDEKIRDRIFSKGIVDYFSKKISPQVMINSIDLLIQTIQAYKDTNILTIDDSPFMTKILKSILNAKGYNVFEAQSAVEAEKILKTQTIHLILLDLIMPKVDGIEFLYILKSDPSFLHVPVIVISADQSRQSYANALKHGANDFIRKPFLTEEVLLKCDIHLKAYYNRLKLLENEKELLEQHKIIENKKKEFKKQNFYNRSLIEANLNPMVVISKTGKITDSNDAATSLMKISKEKLIGSKFVEYFHDQNLGMDVYKKVVSVGAVLDEPIKLVDSSGKVIDVLFNAKVIKNESGVLESIVATAKDVTETNRIQNQIQNYLNLIDENIIISTTDNNGVITYVSEAFCKVSGYTKEELIGKKHSIIKHKDFQNSVYKALWKTIVDNKTWEGEIKNRKKDGSVYWISGKIFPVFDENGIKIGYTSIRQDVTDKKRIEELSITDDLTKIHNRRYFNEIMPKFLNLKKRDKKLVALAVVDVDHFKQYNDTYGHHKGDDTLIKVASILQKSLNRADDYCFRLGGEEFGVLFCPKNFDQAVAFIEQIRINIEQLHIEHIQSKASQYVTASFGLVCKEATLFQDEEQIYIEADKLLYKAKSNGRNQVAYR